MYVLRHSRSAILYEKKNYNLSLLTYLSEATPLMISKLESAD